MSLGLFNCRLIQPAGDQLFFFVGCLAAPLPVRASSVQSPCDPSCSAPTNGRAQNASCLSFPERFCFGFQRGEGTSGADGWGTSAAPAGGPRPTGGRRMLLVFPSQKDFVLVFRGAKSPRAQKGSLPPIHPRISPKIPPSYPQIPL